ncbi:hypothetical protein HAX54_042411 [Datura stramonium]|uniref:Uncharacterized protein n=1 Tax=Datura stramonium TaxID=4076 RepID=A0ABS8W177_DATST|nr:hypothetical protein [Datura stramonium]
MGVIITKEMMWRAVRLSTSLSFPCLITQPCREAHVPILSSIDVETYSIKRCDLEKSKDESRYDLKLHKQIPEVISPSGLIARATKASIKLAGEATGAEVGGASSNSAPQVEGHVIGSKIHLDSTTLVTPPSAMEASMPDPLSVATVPKATIDGSRVTPPQTVVPNSKV